MRCAEARLQRIDHDEQLHQVVIRRIGRRLDDEGVPPAHVLEDFDEDLEVGEAADMAAGQRFAEIGGDRLGQRPVGIAGQNLHLAGHGPLLQTRARRVCAGAAVIAARAGANNMTVRSQRTAPARMSTRKTRPSCRGARREPRLSKHARKHGPPPAPAGAALRGPFGGARLGTKRRAQPYWA